MRIVIGCLWMLVMLPMLCHAQIRKAAQQKPIVPTAKTEASPANRLFEQMLPATAKVMFIDSIVTDKKSFLEKIPLTTEAGTLMRSVRLADTELSDSAYAYLNEYGNKCYLALSTGDSTTLLCTADLLDKQWSTPKPIDELNSEVENPNYPFLLADGTTLYFAAKGGKSMGGYDIFMTIFDSETNRFYSPQNMGLPFNSAANDYLLAIDETNELGWLVSDRNQEEGNVCIYTFVPTETRQSFEGDNLTKERLRSMAQIGCIADTWAFGNRDEAMNRLAAASIRKDQAAASEEKTFVVNDQLVYRHADDFESAEARKSYLQLCELADMLEREESEMEALRSNFQLAEKQEQEKMKEQILKKERHIRQIYHDADMLGKDVRNKEITFINK